MNGRKRSEVLEAFGVDEDRLKENFSREPVVDYLSARGFRIKGKSTSELSPREIFEVLCMREITSKEKVVAVLTYLKGKAAASDRARAARWEEMRPVQFALRDERVELGPGAWSAANWETTIGGRRGAGERAAHEAAGPRAVAWSSGRVARLPC